MEPDKNTPNSYSSRLTEVRPDIFYKVDIVVIGAGQAGLSAAYHLKDEGIEPGRGFVVLDDEFGPWGRLAASMGFFNTEQCQRNQ